MDAILHGVLVDFSVNKGLINFFYFSVIFYFFPPLAFVFRFSGDEKHRNKSEWPNHNMGFMCIFILTSNVIV